MKEWKKPEIFSLGAESTEAGSGVANGDNVLYNVSGYIMMGTSGSGGTPPYPTVSTSHP